jgi:glycosyltransferase involved in cell wall biosynthesis
LKIAFCTLVSISHYGGIEKWICEAAKLMAQRGHRVEVNAFPYEHGNRAVDPAEVLVGIPYREAYKHNVKADVAYVLYYMPFTWRLFSLTAPKIAGMHPAGLVQNTKCLRYWLCRSVERLDLPSFNGIHIVNPAFRTRYPKAYCIPNWIQTNIFKPTCKKSQRFTLLFVGRQRREKGWKTFLEICKQFSASGIDADFQCTGPSADGVNGLGFVSEDRLPEVYSRAHVLVNPTLVDTFGLTILESLACGTPVATTPTPAHLGLELPLFLATTTDDFVRVTIKIHDLWSRDPHSYDIICREARNTATKYGVEHVFPRVEKMFLEVAANRKREAGSQLDEDYPLKFSPETKERDGRVG